MAACGSLQHIFEKSLPESPTLLQSLSPWKHLKSIEDSCFTEFFGELHFKENTDHSPSSSSSSFCIDFNPAESGNSNKENNEREYIPSIQRKHYRNSDSFSSMNSESLSLCTEGLGFESCDDIEDPINNNDWNQREARTSITRHTSNEYLSGKRSRITGGEFPPPISCIGRSGKPWVCFKSYRHNGRFILKEVRIPTQEFLHACREDGRLKLHFIQSDDETIEEDEEEGEEENDDDGFDLGEEDEGDNGERNVEDEDRGEF